MAAMMWMIINFNNGLIKLLSLTLLQPFHGHHLSFFHPGFLKATSFYTVWLFLHGFILLGCHTMYVNLQKFHSVATV